MTTDIQVTITAALNGADPTEVMATTDEITLNRIPSTGDGIMTNHETRAHVERLMVALLDSIR